MKRLFISVLCAAGLAAHPMGNFSVSHFSKLQATAHGVELEYVLDLAEIPTFELLQIWQIERSASQQIIAEHAEAQARDWLKNLSISANGMPVTARLDSAKATVADGAGNLPILRVEMRAHIDAADGMLRYEDRNYQERAGWKEIVLAAGKSVSLEKVSQSNQNLSDALMHYPPDPTVAPPQELIAEMHWKIVKSQPALQKVPPPAVVSIPQPHLASPAVAPATMTAQGAPAGAVTRGDFLSQLLHRKQLSLGLILIALAASFGLGALHALTPGHGKAIVAAYLVGSRGTLKHAAFLGAMVTFTHTITVFALGLATLFLFRFIVPEKITAALGVASGLSIVAIGGFMFYKRLRQYRHGHVHTHSHEHRHDHAHVHEHVHVHGHVRPQEHAHTHIHSHSHVHSHSHSGAVILEQHSHEHVHLQAHEAKQPHTHTHSHGLFGTHTHSHVPEELSWAGLVALGASGGLVPCESALVLLLGAIALNRVGLGLLLLVSFSLGLALVLMGIGVLVIYAKNLLPERARSGRHLFLRWLTLASPAIVTLVGLLMTAASLGWIQQKWMIG